MTPYFLPIKETIENSLQQDTFVKLTLGHYKGTEESLKSVHIKRILIKKEQKLSFTYRYQTRDIVKNYDFIESLALLETLVAEAGFRLLTLFTTDSDVVFAHKKADNWLLTHQKPSQQKPPTTAHDNAKQRKITTNGKHYLHALNITDAAGNVFKNAQDKYKQINHYVEILSSLLNELPNRDLTKVVDMGAGKGYLTFALYDYLNYFIQKPTAVVGVEFRQDLVELCNKIATDSDFEQLRFTEGTIDSYNDDDINVLIALHACDTATDDAIYKGIMAKADLIVVAPCCHKQIRREMQKSKTKNALDFLTKHGIFMERQAEMVTDGLRALLLEYCGYSTKVFEFVSDAHTPKNVLIVGQKKQTESTNQTQILNKIQETKAFFGIEYHHLEQKLGINEHTK